MAWRRCRMRCDLEARDLGLGSVPAARQTDAARLIFARLNDQRQTASRIELENGGFKLSQRSYRDGLLPHAEDQCARAQFLLEGRSAVDDLVNFDQSSLTGSERRALAH